MANIDKMLEITEKHMKKLNNESKNFRMELESLDRPLTGDEQYNLDRLNNAVNELQESISKLENLNKL